MWLWMLFLGIQLWLKWKGQTHNSLCKCFRRTCGPVVELIHDVVRRAEAIPANRGCLSCRAAYMTCLVPPVGRVSVQLRAALKWLRQGTRLILNCALVWPCRDAKTLPAGMEPVTVATSLRERKSRAATLKCQTRGVCSFSCLFVQLPF